MKQEMASNLSEQITGTPGGEAVCDRLSKARADVYAALMQHGKGKVTITLEFDGTDAEKGLYIAAQAKTQAECPAVKTELLERTVMAGDPLPGMEVGR